MTGTRVPLKRLLIFFRFNEDEYLGHGKTRKEIATYEVFPCPSVAIEILIFSRLPVFRSPAHIPEHFSAAG
jgi:hypothetical protein